MMAIPDTRATLTRRMQEHIFSKDTPMTEFLAADEEEGLPLSTGGLEFAMALESIRTRRTARGVVTVRHPPPPPDPASLQLQISRLFLAMMWRGTASGIAARNSQHV